jgi:hypothetical protein
MLSGSNECAGDRSTATPRVRLDVARITHAKTLNLKPPIMEDDSATAARRLPKLDHKIRRGLS